MSKWIKMAMLGLVLSFGLAPMFGQPVFGQDVTKSVSIKRDSKIGGQAISPGNYSIRFTDDKDGELVLSRGGHEVAKVAYTLTRLNHPASDTAVVFTVGTDGSYEISRIEFRGSGVGLEIAK
ncbi:MAG TPA: hypothetical protein VJX67_05920 [Blastocatellia bacterium]|nr:hypothetical protein [Blastocatellia bacterium]